MPRRTSVDRPMSAGRVSVCLPIPAPGGAGERGSRPEVGAVGITRDEGGSMKAVVYQGPRDVSVKDVPDARIERPDRRPGPDHHDQHLRLGPAHVRGPDRLRDRPGSATRTWARSSRSARACDKVKVGDCVVLPFNVACGHCKNCERGLTNYCLTAQPEPQWPGRPTASPTWARRRRAGRAAAGALGRLQLPAPG